MLPPKSLYLPPPLVDFEHKDPNEANPVFFLYYLQYSYFVFTKVPSSNLYSVLFFNPIARYQTLATLLFSPLSTFRSINFSFSSSLHLRLALLALYPASSANFSRVPPLHHSSFFRKYSNILFLSDSFILERYVSILPMVHQPFTPFNNIFCHIFCRHYTISFFSDSK